MAQPTTLRFGAASFWLSDAGSSPDQFQKVCGLNELTLELTKETNDVTVADCDDPDAASWTARDVVALGWSFSGAGILAVESLALLESTTWRSSVSRMRLVIEGASNDPLVEDLTYEGDCHVSFSLDATRGEKIGVEISVEGSGGLLLNGGLPTDELTPPDGYAFLTLGGDYLTLNGDYLMIPI